MPVDSKLAMKMWLSGHCRMSVSPLLLLVVVDIQGNSGVAACSMKGMELGADSSEEVADLVDMRWQAGMMEACRMIIWIESWLISWSLS
jgi:hypothetical protein